MTSRLLGVILLAGLTQVRTDWRVARPDYAWSFPQDHWSHPGYRAEWWYLTGHLTPDGATAPRYGYQFTFFRVGLLPRPTDSGSTWSAVDLVMGHAALTDVATGRHVFSEVLYRATPLLGGFGAHPDSLIAWSRGPVGTAARWTLRWNGRAFRVAMTDAAQRIAFDLSTEPARALVFQGPNGFSRKGAGPTAASQYYSFTRLRTSGTVTVGDSTARVSGESWMDKEFGSNQLAASQVGWDWFSLQLDGGRELMLYLLRDSTGGVDYASGTLVPRSGAPRYLAREDFRVAVTRHWRSAASDAEYPAGWVLEVPQEGLRLVVEPLVADQENRSRLLPKLFYWEGAVRVRGADGRPAGRGYVEMTGYGRGARPAV